MVTRLEGKFLPTE